MEITDDQINQLQIRMHATFREHVKIESSVLRALLDELERFRLEEADANDRIFEFLEAWEKHFDD